MAGLRFRWLPFSVSVLLLALVSLPYVFAARAGGEAQVFAGFLLNPLDGNSYLAKMYAGWRGDWLFTLPYTAEAGKGHFLFTYYLLLGHLARFSGLPLIMTFHAARLLAAGVMLLALYRFMHAVFPDGRLASLAFALAALGSGLGWLALPWGAFTADFWVAEAYPFLSAYANPHFPLGLALMLWLLKPPVWEKEPKSGVREIEKERELWGTVTKYVAQRNSGGTFLASALLAAVSPFGVVILVIVLASLFAWEVFASRSSASLPEAAGDRTGDYQTFALRLSALSSRLPWVLLGGAPLLLYDLWVSHTDPLLATWNAQNLTPSPPLWDLAVSLSPVLPLALFGARRAWQRGSLADRLLLAWVGTSLLLAILPFGLQRRFLTGLYVPLAALAVLGFAGLSQSLKTGKDRPFGRRFLAGSLFLLALPTNLVVLMAGWHGIRTLDPGLYLARGEAQAFQWIVENTSPDALILAAPGTGLFIPARTSRRVLYGHPFETTRASREKEAVTQFFKSASPDLTAWAGRGVNYLFIGPRERELNPAIEFSGLLPVYQAGGVSIYPVDPIR